ncbi:MAG: ribulose-phosphate 3-epimerase [Chloroflexota bacterium]|nr:ribulose-phosphate 3-epimerase [Chloroflexota bacterium]
MIADEGSPGVSQSAILIGPSILTADFLHLGDQLAEAEAAGVDYVHVDIMDGLFVPNISIGLPIVAAVRRATKLPVDVHLMMVDPERYVDAFAAAGADSLTVHVEATRHLYRTIQAIAAAGMTPGVTLNPGTPLLTVEPVLPTVGQVLVMSVNPGFGGQSFIPAALDRIRRLAEMIDATGREIAIQVDGGVNAATIAAVRDAGATKVVVGSALFDGASPVAAGMDRLRAALAG